MDLIKPPKRVQFKKKHYQFSLRIIRMLSDEFNPLEGKMLQIIGSDGTVDKRLEPSLDGDLLQRAYQTMILARVADEKAVRLQRQGKIGAYPPSRGQEASQIGPALALGPDDWIIPGFRELTALIWRGVPLLNLFLYWSGNEEGNAYPEGVKVTPGVIPVGDQIPHAVGVSYASKLRGEKVVTMTYFGDGGSSEGSFHEGLNLAGVLKTPTIFICQNNQYAISLPRSKQTASKTIAQKAIAYGFPGIMVDGNDVLALYVAAKEAVDRARGGGGPTLIESYTYRLGDHTTSDDATRYRNQAELTEWEAKDPLHRFRVYLENKGLWNEDKEKASVEEAKSRVDEESQKALDHPSPQLEDIFKYTYRDLPSELQNQLKFFKKDLEQGGSK
jgi:pyruvate dehydrogenase E1 component alpha subunit